MDMIREKLVGLRPATLADRRSVYEWLANSDLTSQMPGPPLFPGNPVPTWDEFINDYTDTVVMVKKSKLKWNGVAPDPAILRKNRVGRLCCAA